MSKVGFSRRCVIERGLLAVPAFALMPSLAKAAGACADPTDSLRASLHYVEASGDPKQPCGMCGFFEEAEKGDCGSCKIFNGPANVKGHCDSWAAKG